MRTTHVVLALGVLIAWLGLTTEPAAAQGAPTAQFRLGRGRPYAGVPFALDLVIEGFEENPAPTHPPLKIDNATIEPLDVTPNVTTGLRVENGRRTEIREVTWVVRWRVTPTGAGTLRVPQTTVTQGSRSVTARPGEVPVEAIAATDDMKVALEVPQRAVVIGETIPMKLVWLFRRQPESQTLVVPLAGADAFTISAPPADDPRKALEVTVAGQTLGLPYEVDEVTANGGRWNRLVVTFYAAPKRAGTLQLAPSTVTAALQIGRDFFNSQTKMFRAADVARTMDVKALPETGRPPSFAGAVGEQFSIAVRTSRSVVQLGEPVELAIEVKSNQRLDTLSLGNLGGPGMLPKETFAVPPDPPTGVLSDDGTTKQFTVVAQLVGPATEVPALAFSYFDPVRSTYQTIHSEPIALSVKGGGTVVGAGDVVAAKPTKPSPVGPRDEDLTKVAAELALSSPSAVDSQPLAGGGLWALVIALYAVPIALFGVRSYRLRTAGGREDAAEVRAARVKAEALLDRASAAPARDLAGPLAAALRELARVAGGAAATPTLGSEPADRDVLARLETESFAPAAAGNPLSAELRGDAAGLVRRYVAAARGAPRAARPRRTDATAATLLGVMLLGGLVTEAHADALADGRAAYQEAMALTGDATGRKAAFTRAAVALGEAARTTPGRPELLADWGNAALGAGDLGTATLAYRRALAIDGNTARARKNLAWLRSRQPDAYRPVTDIGATDTLLFFHAWPQGHRLLVGAFAFALAVLCLVPWGGSRRRALTGVAVLPAVVWVAMLGSVVLEDRRASDAIVREGVMLRAADSAGAPAALAQPVPVGAEVTVLEHRETWTRIRVANGTVGWVPRGATEAVN